MSEHVITEEEKELIEEGLAMAKVSGLAGEEDIKQDLINYILKDRELLNNMQIFDCNYKARAKGNLTDKKAKEYFDIYYDINNLHKLIRDKKEGRDSAWYNNINVIYTKEIV